MKTLHEENLEQAREYLKAYKESLASKLFRGVHLRYFTKEELIKILDIYYKEMFERKFEIKEE
jgi:hypothetical protein